MFKVRVIPCLDVKDGRVVKGVNFVNLRDAGDPVEAAIAYDAAGADELTLPRHHREPREPRHHPRRGAAHRGSLLHAAHRRRRRAHGRGYPQAAAPPAPTRCRSTPRRWPGAPSSRRRRRNSATSASWWRSTPRRCRSRASRTRWEIFTHGGRNPTGLDAVDYANEVVALGAGEILLTSMDRDGTRQGFDIALTRAVADAVPVPVIASGGVGTLEHLVEGIRDGHATAVLAASIFHFGEHTRARGQAIHGARRAADAARSVDALRVVIPGLHQVGHPTDSNLTIGSRVRDPAGHSSQQMAGTQARNASRLPARSDV